MTTDTHAVREIQLHVTEQAVTCDIYRADDNGVYDESMSSAGTVDVAVSDASGTNQLVDEGMDTEVSMVGHVVPTYTNNTLDDPLRVGDELRPHPTSQRYDVQTKVGVPNEIEPELWVLGLDRASGT